MPEPGLPRGAILGFDFGLRRIGVATGHTMTGLASAIAVVAHGEHPDWPAIDRLIREWRPDALLVGLPLDAGGEETDMSRRCRAFGSDLQQRYERPVCFADERLTSLEARDQFVAGRKSGNLRARDARKLDARAAQIMLENWLQSLPAEERTN